MICQATSWWAVFNIDGIHEAERIVAWVKENEDIAGLVTDHKSLTRADDVSNFVGYFYGATPDEVLKKF